MSLRTEVSVLHRDGWFLVLAKPSGIPTTSPGDVETLTSIAHAIDDAAPRLHPSSRLDAEVSGVVVFARTRAATEHLLAARRAGTYQRGYLALASTAPAAAAGHWHGAIAIDPRNARKRALVHDDAKGARVAHTRYRMLASTPAATLLWLEPETGRTHQLRVHAAAAGLALLGDRHYGGAPRIVLPDGSVHGARRTMLHCARVSLPDPAGGEALRFETLPPVDFGQLWAAAGGRGFHLP